MHRKAPWLALLALWLAGCSAGPGLPVPAWPAPPPVAPAPPPPAGPVQPPPPQTPPPPAPASLQAVLDRVVVGATAEDAEAAVGLPVQRVPASQAGRATLRWIVDVPEGRFLVYAVLEAGRVADKGATPVEAVR